MLYILLFLVCAAAAAWAVTALAGWHWLAGAAVFLIASALLCGAGAALNMTESALKDQDTADFYVLSRIRVITRVCVLSGTFFCFWAVFRYIL